MKTQTKNQVAIEGRPLRAALASVLRVIEKRNTYPILGTVRLTYADAALTLTGTDLDMEITTRLDVNQGEGSFDICVDPRILGGIAKVAGVDLVRIEVFGKLVDGLKPEVEPEARVTIGNDTSYTLPVQNPDAWPTLPGDRGALIERFTNGSLAQMLGKVVGYISTEETRYYLNGVCWQNLTTGRRFAATDGHRMGVCRYSGGEGENWSRIIPRKTVKLVLALAAGMDVDVFDMGAKPGIEFQFGSTTIRSKLIEGTFPDIDRVIPNIASAPHHLKMSRLDVLAAIDRVMALSNDRYGRAIRWFGRDGELVLSVNGIDAGKVEASVAVPMPDTVPDFGLNGRYIREMIAACQGDITMHVTDERSPFRITDEDESMTRVLMPMRVS